MLVRLLTHSPQFADLFWRRRCVVSESLHVPCAFFAVAKRSFSIFLHNNTFRSFGSFSSDLNFALSGCANGSNWKRLKSNRIKFPSSFFLTIKTDAPSESKKKNIFRIKTTNCNCKIKKYQKKKKTKIEETTLQDFTLQLIPYGIVGVVVNELNVQIK